MAKKPETSITQAIITYIKDLGGDAYHVHGSATQRGGEPDIDGWCTPIDNPPINVHLKLEVKVPGEELMPRQRYRLQRYWKAGYLAGVVTSIEDLKLLIKCYIRWKWGDGAPMPDTWGIYGDEGYNPD